MSIIQSMREHPLVEEIPYIVERSLAIHETKHDTMSVILLHNVKDKDIVLYDVLHAYMLLEIHNIYVLSSDGTELSDPVDHMHNVIALTYKKEDSDNTAITFGELVNSAMNIVDTDIVFVSWTNIHPCRISSTSFMHNIHDDPLCIVPAIENKDGHSVSSTFSPKKNMSGIVPHRMYDNHLYPFTLFPFDGIGMYDRNKFLKIGGINTSIKDSYWQLYEFGLRSYMNDMIIRLSPYNKVRNINDMDNVPKSTPVVYHTLCLKFSLGFKLFHFVRCMLAFSYSGLRDVYTLRISNTYNKMQKKKISRKLREYWS